MLDSGETALQCQAGVVSGNVSIMTSCSGILQPDIRTFLTENREIHYQQYRYTSELIAAQLEGGPADFAVTTTPPFPPQNSPGPHWWRRAFPATVCARKSPMS